MKSVILLSLYFVCVLCQTTGSSTTGSVPQILNTAFVDVNATCERFSSTNCGSSIFYEVFVNTTYSQTDMAKSARYYLTLAAAPTIPDGCREAAVDFTCGLYYQQCMNIPDTPYSVSVPPCKSLCLRVNKECGPIVGVQNELDCDLIDQRTKTPAYPSSSITWSYYPPGSNSNSLEYATYSCNTMRVTNSTDNYYANLVKNPDLKNTSNWDNLNAATPYTIEKDIVNGTTSDVLVLNATSLAANGKMGASQMITINQSYPANLRLKTKTKGTCENKQCFIQMDLKGKDGSTSSLKLLLETTSEYETYQTEHNATFAIETATISLLLTKDSSPSQSMSFDQVALQEKITNPPSSPDDIVCPDVLVRNPYYEAGSNDSKKSSLCTIGCPVVWVWSSPTAFMRMITSDLVFSYISLFASSFVIITWLVVPNKRRFPHRYVLGLAIGAWLSAFQGVIMLSSFEFNDVVCYDSVTTLTQENAPRCLFSGMFVQAGASTLIAYWTCITVTLFLRIRSPNKNFLYLEKYFHGASLTYIIISTCLPATIHKYSNTVLATGGCWISTENNSWWVFGFFYIPLGILLCTALILIPIIIYHIWTVTHNIKHSSKKNKSYKIVFAYIKLSGFLVFFCACLSIMFGYKFESFRRNDEWMAKIHEEVACKLLGGGEECVKFRVNIVPLFFNQLAVKTIGLTTFLFFGCEKKLFQFWWRKFLNLCQPIISQINKRFGLAIGAKSGSKGSVEINLDTLSKNNSTKMDSKHASTIHVSSTVNNSSSNFNGSSIESVNSEDA